MLLDGCACVQALDKKQALLSGAAEQQRTWQNRKGMVTHEVAAKLTEVNTLQGVFVFAHVSCVCVCVSVFEFCHG